MSKERIIATINLKNDCIVKVRHENGLASAEKPNTITKIIIYEPKGLNFILNGNYSFLYHVGKQHQKEIISQSMIDITKIIQENVLTEEQANIYKGIIEFMAKIFDKNENMEQANFDKSILNLITTKNDDMQTLLFAPEITAWLGVEDLDDISAIDLYTIINEVKAFFLAIVKQIGLTRTLSN